MSERGFIGELMYRRVPQYLGLYIAGVWLGIEMGDWLSEQFVMPERLTTYIFVFMAVMLPTVALFAWTHGAPGKDQASKAQMIFVPFNIVLAAFGVFLVPETAPSTEAATLADTAFVEEAATRPSSQRVISYYLANNTAEAPDWYAYILPILLSEDLLRESPAFTALTPFDADSLLQDIVQSGFANAMRVPQSLQLQLARDRRYNYFVRGELVDAESGGMTMRYAMHDVVTGEPRVTGEVTFTDDSLFAAVDEISVAVQEELEQNISDSVQMTDLPISESMSPNFEALRLYTEARIAANLDKDGPRGGALMQQAVEADPQFAEAHHRIGMFHYFNGSNDLAEQSFDAALRYSFRLSNASEYQIKINKAAISGDFEGARDIARAWTRVEPGNESAFRQLARINVVTALDLEEAKAAFVTVRELNPMAISTLKASAQIEQQLGNTDAAEALLLKYTEKAPDDVSGLSALAQLQALNGDGDAALDTFRQASLLDDRNIEPKLGAISVLMRRGDYAQAEDRLTRLLQSDLTDQQKLNVFTIASSMYTQRGKYADSIRIMTEAEPIMMRVQGPLMTTLQATAPKIVQQGFLDEDPEVVLGELDALGATMQAPWTDFIALYKAGLLAAHNQGDAFVANLGSVERFATTQPSNANLQFMTDSYRAKAAVYEDRPEDAVALINLALERSESSWLAVFLSGEILSMQAEMYDTLRRAGEIREAISGLEGIVTRYPGLAIAHLRLAQAYFDLGRESQARDALDAVKEIWQEADDTLVYLQEVANLEAALDERA
ncbi:MAG: tetratricopeptide repeat protein [Pseudomonadota bacterium]